MSTKIALLIIFLHISIRLFEQLLILVEFVLRQRAPQGLADFAFAAFGGLPAFEVELADDLEQIFVALSWVTLERKIQGITLPYTSIVNPNGSGIREGSRRI